MSEKEPAVLFHQDGPIATLTLNRPRALNAFDSESIHLLTEYLEKVAEDSEVRVVILTGTGRAFCAGGDLRAIREASQATEASLEKGLAELAAVFHQGIRTIRRMKKPVVAALNGITAGGGLSLALACDLRVMAASAMMRQAYTSNGLCVDGGGTWTLPRLVGMARALEMTLLDDPIPAEKALALGLTSRIFPDEEFVVSVAALATKLAAKPVGSLGLVKQLIDTSFETELEPRLREEEQGIASQAASPEGQEGIAAFLEKRKPRYI
jgi:2-(1,2-epoxy-1,2-dihydrophenyl)acetyl-CoA isomerase